MRMWHGDREHRIICVGYIVQHKGKTSIIAELGVLFLEHHDGCRCFQARALTPHFAKSKGGPANTLFLSSEPTLVDIFLPASHASLLQTEHSSKRLWRGFALTATAIIGGTSVILCEARPAQPVPPSAPSPGKLILMGAGPGASDLLTLRAVRALETADVVVCDELIGQDVLAHCRADCEIIVMGKRGGSAKATKQSDINSAIVAHCQQGKTVVRVKGGDPLLFGRMADEVRAARQHR